MKTSFVSSQAISTALRYSLVRMQTDLQKAQKEVVTGKAADTGLVLGSRTGQAVSLTRDVQRLNGIIDSNGLVSARLDATQKALGQISKLAESFRTALTAGLSGTASSELITTDATATIEALTGILNSSLNGEYLFAGINTDVRPINDYAASGAANKAAFDAAFLAEFGFPQDDPQATNIPAADMQAFLDNQVDPLFMSGAWNADWSSATDDRIVSRIALHETAETSVSANNEGVRKLMMAATSVYELLQAPLNSSARETVIQKAMSLVSEAISNLTTTQGQVGLVQSRVTAASERLSIQVDLFTLNVNDMEGVDPYEASTRISSLLTQIETAYSLTARIQQLSLLRFLG